MIVSPDQLKDALAEWEFELKVGESQAADNVAHMTKEEADSMFMAQDPSAFDTSVVQFSDLWHSRQADVNRNTAPPQTTPINGLLPIDLTTALLWVAAGAIVVTLIN